LEAYVRAAHPDPAVPAVAALVDGELRELNWPVQKDVLAVPITMADSDGLRIYQRSLSFLLVVAAHQLFPEAEIFVDHSMPFGGFFCRVEGREPFNAEELARLEARMRELVDQNLPITRQKITLDEALALFRARGEQDVVRLISQRRKDELAVHELLGYRDAFHGYMVPSTGYLRYFALCSYPPGFVLRFPCRHRPAELLPVEDSPKLVAVFREYGEWMQVIGVTDVAALNEAIPAQRMDEIILVSEALHEQRVAQIAAEIAQRRGRTRLVLIAGPSAAGKTTFAKRLAVQLLAHEVRPLALELDNYFVERDLTPRDEEGNYDFEALEALDLPLFNAQLLDLIAGRQVTLPRYDFETGQREIGEVVCIGPEHVILVEGIHGLNPALVPQVPPELVYRVYVSAFTQLNLDRHNRVPTSDTRLVRRLVRDARTRGYTPRETIARWDSVRRGEERYIFPYQEQADVMFNSALVYELSVLKPFAEALLRQIEPGTREYVEAKRLLSFLEWFEPYPPDVIPNNSILREFVGGSILDEFKPWRQRAGESA